MVMTKEHTAPARASKGEILGASSAYIQMTTTWADAPTRMAPDIELAKELPCWSATNQSSGRLASGSPMTNPPTSLPYRR